MDINVSVTTGLDLLGSHKKLLIQFLVELIKNQASLGGHQGRVRIGILLISHIHNGLALLVHIVQHPNKVLFIVAIIPVTLGHNRLHLFQCALHDIVHDGNGDFRLAQLVHLVHHILADMMLLLIGKLCQGTIGAFAHGVDHLLHIKGFLAAIFLDDIHRFLRLEYNAIILCDFRFLYCHIVHSIHPFPIYCGCHLLYIVSVSTLHPYLVYKI